jgi:hypothetical protein
MATKGEVIRALSGRMKQIFWFVATHPHGVMRKEIFDYLYEDDPDGGPESEHIIWTLVTYLNARLAPSGLIVRKEFARRHMCGYQLRRLDNGHIWMPFV